MRAMLQAVDARMHIHQSGHGEPVVLLHSTGSSGRQWGSLIEALGPGVHALAVDLYGHGNTPPWAAGRPLRLADEAALVEIALARCRGPVHLVGHSYGGAVALHVALARPERVRSLTLIEPVAFHLLRRGDPRQRRLCREILRLARDIAHAARAGRPEAGMARFIDYWNGEGSFASLPEARRQAFCAMIGTVVGNFAALLRERNGLEACQDLAAPTLILAGERSPAPALRIAALLEAALPAARRVVVEGAGHMLPLTHKETVNPLILRHLALEPLPAAA
jgi:pimeloyl-ACP methyl ester carboxylesterase